MFWRLLTVADGFGRFDARPVVMLVDCFKLRAHSILVEQVAGWYNEMENAELVMSYTVDTKVYGVILKWGQRRKAAFSKFPPPPGWNDGGHEDGTMAGMRTTEVRGTRYEVRGTRNEVGVGASRANQLADQDFIQTLKDDKTYNGIDIDKELGKCHNWMRVNVPGKQLTRRRFINWLNRADVPMKRQTDTQQKGLFIRESNRDSRAISR